MAQLKTNLKGMTFVEKVILSRGCETVEEAFATVSSELFRRYGGTARGEEKLKELGMETTSDIRRNVEIWFTMRHEFPDYKLTDRVQKIPEYIYA